MPNQLDPRNANLRDGRLGCVVLLLSLLPLALGPAAHSQNQIQQETFDAQSVEELSADQRQRLEKNIGQLIDQLGSDSFAQRQRAENELRRIGLLALDQLLESAVHPDPQIASTSHYLLESIQQVWTWRSDAFEVSQILEHYGNESQEERIARIDRLRLLPDQVALAALCRLARYETNHRLSKHAALAIVQDTSHWSPERQTLHVATIRQAIGQNHREACRWLLTLADSLESGTIDRKAWAEIADQQRELLARRNPTVLAQDVIDLHRWICGRLIAQEDRASAIATANQMIGILPTTSERLLEACQWALKVGLPEFVQEAARRHEAVFGSYAMLRYTLAESHLEAGDPQQAEDLARKVLARGQSGPNRPPSVVERERTAQQLWVRSRHAWAQAELEAALAQSDLIQRSAWESAGLLSRLHEDAERYKEAASVWEPFADRLVHEPGYRAQIDETFKDHEEGMTQSRMCLAHYYYLQAMARRESDAPQAYEYLCKALEMDDKEIDATIALYRLRDNAFAQSKAQEAIARIQKSLRAKIGEATDQSNQRNDLFATMLYWQQTALNNLAWLQINTGGDAREALSMAERACSLSPDTASYLDTLARCHFVLGDAPQAISFQKMAIDLEPYSLALKRPLLEYETSFESPPLSPNQ